MFWEFLRAAGSCHRLCPVPLLQEGSSLLPDTVDAQEGITHGNWKSLVEELSGRTETRWDVKDGWQGTQHHSSMFPGHWWNVAHPQEVLVEQEEKHRMLQGETGDPQCQNARTQQHGIIITGLPRAKGEPQHGASWSQ